MADHKWLDIDFEFHNSSDYRPNIVCCSIWDSDLDETFEFWTYNDDAIKSDLREFLYARKDTHILRAYMAIAEARSLLAIDIEDAKEFKWVDLYIEWRQLTNHNDRMSYGNQLIGGREVKTYPLGQWERKKKHRNYSKCEYGLAASTYKLLGIKIDTSHKTTMRDIIISGVEDVIECNKDEIQEYCTSDIVHLRNLYTAMVKEYKRLLSKKDFALVHEEMLYRGEYAARTAYIEREGEPMNMEWIENFAASVPQIIRSMQQEINDLFPDILPFRYKRIDGNYSWNQIATKAWIRTLNPDIVSQWKTTDSGDISLSLEAFTKFFSYRHTYPKHCLGGQIVRYLRLKQSLNGFLPSKKGKRNFFDSVGSDGRARPFLGIYGSQSGRNQPSATGFLFLKAAWSRALSEPPKGYICADIDYASQEFLGGALGAQDKVMVDAYHSGDPYLFFAKATGAVPEDATKASHGEQRNLFKST
ncbi:MAG: hypothetical protein KAG61_13240, partial [Bacteriovoracaceae bacterium]|nr:hypothetical protein [Bacteriovoracaceae bacterium]